MKLLAALLLSFIPINTAKLSHQHSPNESIFIVEVPWGGLGTAWSAGPRTLITAGHVCEDSRTADDFLAPKKEQKELPDAPILLYKLTDHGTQIQLQVDVRVKEIYMLHDLCVLETSWNVGPVLKLAKKEPKHGDQIMIMGAPWGMLGVITEGRVAQPHFVVNGVDYLLLSCSVTAGNSGSPILNKYGRVVGVLVAGYPAYQQLSLGVPLEVVRAFLENSQEW